MKQCNPSSSSLIFFFWWGGGGAETLVTKPKSNSSLVKVYLHVRTVISLI